ncbi:DNA/RNA helicase domain-containing protein [Microbispora sp. NPDC049125]|uniref:DNA/RNA helicase domain-containing protein n=1 Tax=Microbispora sp. NPDC049125 TaxID=3154929 RepID=UPI0034675D59
MAVFRHSAESLVKLVSESVPERLLSGIIADHLKATTGLTPSMGERKSWDRSLPILARDLVEAGLGDVEMMIEYRLPLSSKRADVILAGVDRRTGGDAYVIVELKQWSQADLYEDDPDLVLVPGMSSRPKLHPVLQVRGYCDYLADFVGALAEHRDAVRGVAYLHNASDPDIHDLYGHVRDERTRLFSKTRRGAFLDYLRAQFAPGSGADAADRLLTSAIRPSKQLLALAAEEIRNREQFVLLAEQRLAYQMVLHVVEKARAADSKEVVIVTGGPGSGKSVIALSLLGELSRQGRPVLHATGSRSFTQTMRRHVGKGSTRLQNLFKYFNGFINAARNDLDVLICDEAHRIREKSENQYTRAALRTGRPQVDELIAAARVPVFLLDEHQVVRPGEIGTVAAIKAHAESLGLRVHEVALDGQFRCGGSRKYEDWVLRLLGLDGGEPGPWTGDDHFEVTLAESPHELEAVLRERLERGYSARMTAGFCWRWSEPRKDDTLVPDVQIGDWTRPWNVKGERSVGDAPASALWATLPGGFEQVGCVYTAQGFEYDWNGVIIGPDLVVRDGELVTVRAASRDPALMKRTVTDEQADRLIRNTYKVLLTRGMVGTVVYSADPETQEFLSALVEHGTVTIPDPV